MKKLYTSFHEVMQLREIQSLRNLSHPNVVQLKEVVRESNGHLCLVFEHMDANLYQVMKCKSNNSSAKPIPLSDQKIRSITRQMLQGLSFMHQRGFFHRDIKPENILVKGDILKVADFGLAREVRSRPPFTDYVSTRWYRAPEILLRSKIYNSPIDLFAVGCILAELLTLRPLFPGSNEIDQLHKLFQILGTPTESNWSEGVKLLANMKCKFKPMPATDLKRHVNVDGNSDGAMALMIDLLEMNPKKRPTACQALQYPYVQIAGLSSDLPQSPGLLANPKEVNEQKENDHKVVIEEELLQMQNNIAVQKSTNIHSSTSSNTSPQKEKRHAGFAPNVQKKEETEGERNPFAENYLSTISEPATAAVQSQRRVTDVSNFGAPQFKAATSSASAPAPAPMPMPTTHSHGINYHAHRKDDRISNSSAHSNNPFEASTTACRSTAAPRSTPLQHHFPSANHHNRPIISNTNNNSRMSSSRDSVLSAAAAQQQQQQQQQHNPFQNLNSPIDRNYNNDQHRNGTSSSYTYPDSSSRAGFSPFNKKTPHFSAKPSSRSMRGVGRRAIMGSSSSSSRLSSSPFGAQQFSSGFSGEHHRPHPRTSRYHSV